VSNLVTVDQLLGRAERRALDQLPQGQTYKELSTVIVTPVRGPRTIKDAHECDHCGNVFEYDKGIYSGFAPIVVESWKRMIKPMNQPIQEILATGYEVGDAYQKSIEMCLQHPEIQNYKYVLFLEDDVVIPFMPGTKGPLWQLYDRIADGYDVANGLYWTKGEISMPLIFGDPQKGNDNFECLTEGWEAGDVVECNGAGMGFSLWKMDIFKDSRWGNPWFKTLESMGEGVSTQDLFAYGQIRKLGYRVCVDTSIRCGHFNVYDGEVY
jgi:hypothetical protein